MRNDLSPGQLTIGLVAGEISGDQLGGVLIEALRERLPAARFVGLAGEHMRAAGCESLGSCEELAVMGLVEPLRHLPRLLRLRSRLRREFLSRRIDVFVGVDAPAFNLGLARWLKSRGIPTAQYVSPQVWAWRAGRIPGIARSVDAVLCLLPFEPPLLCGASRARALCRASHGRSHPPGKRSRRRARRTGIGAGGLRGGGAARQPPRRGHAAGCGLRGRVSRARDRGVGPVQFIAPMAVTGDRGSLRLAGGEGWCFDPAAGPRGGSGAGRGGRRAGGLGHRDAAGAAAWLPDGGGLSTGAR